MSASPNLRLPYLDANQNQKSVTHNAALRMLDALVNLHVASAALSAPPAAPNDGQCWIVASGGTGAWAGKDSNVAAWQDGAWSFYAPNPGTVAYVDALGGALVWNGIAWVSLLGAITALALSTLGVGTAADPANPLSARLNAALFSALPTTASPAGTGDVRVKLSKQGAANTASLLFQDNFAGRAEIGLVGDDSFHVKVSSDGATFVDAIVVAAAGGGVSFLLPPTAPTPVAGDSTTKLATTAFVAAAVGSGGGAVASVAGRTGAVTLAAADVAGAAPLASPALTGIPTAPNAAAGTNTAQLATTSFVAASFVTYSYASATYATATNATLTGTPTAPTASQNDNSLKLATTAYADRAANAGNLTRRQVADVAATVLASDRVVAVTALTAARILVLPAAAAYPGGATLTVVDESGACSATATITVAAAGSDTINGAASAVVASAYGYLALESNTFNKWTVVDSPASTGATPPIGDNSAKLATTAFTRSNARRPGLFHVYRGATAQTGIVGFTKFQLDTKDYDLDGWYDNTINYRYAPQEAGYYLLYCGCQLAMGAATTDGAIAAIYKNGALARQSGPMFSLSSAICISGAAEVGAMIYLNGTSDYVEFYVYATPGGSSTSSGSNSQYRNYAGGCKVSA